MLLFEPHLHSPPLFSSSSSSKPSTPTRHIFSFWNFRCSRSRHHQLRLPLVRTNAISPYAPDELPVDEDFLKNFAPKDKESEDEARRRNWIERGWAPWEEILTPEANFARLSLNEGEEVALQSPEAIEAFKMLSPEYRRRKMEESGMTEDEWYVEQFRIKGEIPDPVETVWDGPLVLRMVPPRDWPPRGWEVDREELEFIRGAHRMQSERVDLDEEVSKETDKVCLDRYKVFLKQYKEWVEANKDRLEEESYKVSTKLQLLCELEKIIYRTNVMQNDFIYQNEELLVSRLT